MPPAIPIRTYAPADEAAVVALWTRVFGYTEARNEPRYVLDLKQRHDDGLLLLTHLDKQLIGTAMGGFDGHRGWLYSIAIDPDHRRRGHGAALVHALEARLRALGAPKINLQIRRGNEDVIPFYEALGYACEPHTSMGRVLKR